MFNVMDELIKLYGLIGKENTDSKLNILTMIYELQESENKKDVINRIMDKK